MSLQKLPVELLLQITSDLNRDDQCCFRLVCRRFYDLVYPHYRFYTTVQNSVWKKARAACFARLSFLERICRPGNLFGGMDVRICAQCKRIQHTRRFPLPQLLVDDFPVCETCLVGLMSRHVGRGHRMAYSSATYETGLTNCKECEKSVVQEELDKHEAWGTTGYGESGLLCRKCHLNECRAADCPGWRGEEERNITLRYHLRLMPEGDEVKVPPEDRCYCFICHSWRASSDSPDYDMSRREWVAGFRNF